MAEDETCTTCGRKRPDYIADPTCRLGGYCCWAVKGLSVREAARRHQPLDGADAQALEGALTSVEKELEDVRTNKMANLALVRADVLDILKVCGIKPAGITSFADDLQAIKRYVRGLQDTVDKLRGELSGLD